MNSQKLDALLGTMFLSKGPSPQRQVLCSLVGEGKRTAFGGVVLNGNRILGPVPF